jgi:hypothetical protein
MTTIAQPSPATVAGHLADLRDKGELQPKVEPRCRICRDPQVLQIVNDLLAHGHTYPSIVALLEPLNATRPAKSRITKACVFKHRKHFDLRAGGRAVWRRVLEDRAAESQGAFEDGVASLVNAASYFEVMMRKGFETLVAEDTAISAEQGAWAAKQHHEIIRYTAGSQDMASLHRQLGRVVQVIRDVVPPAYHQQIVDILEGREVAPALQAPGRAVEEYDPMVDADDEDFEED